jgi:type IV secretion system protein VirB10
MLQGSRLTTTFLIALVSLTLASAADSDRDFSGKWLLNADHSETHALSGEIYPVLTIEQRSLIHCTATTAAGGSVEWSYRMDGEDSKYKLGDESLNSAVKWEGAALLINTLVNGPQSYTIMDRWTLSRDRSQLNIQRHIVNGPREQEGYLIYRREGAMGGPASSTGTAVPESTDVGSSATTPTGFTAPTTLVRRPETPAPPPPTQFTIAQGTHILLTLTNPVSTKNSKDGDRVYLQTAIPVALDGHIVIPRGSYVQASVNKSKPAGHGSEKGELYIRFDSITLPNGVNRDFHARLTSADTVNGKVDPDEGKISGTGKNTKPGELGRDVGIGSLGGVLIGGAAGHPITGLGVGAAAGAAAVLLGKNKDVVLPRGTSVEMVLDRDLYYTADELRH